MSYTDLTATFVNKLRDSYQNGQRLVANDNYLYEMLRTYRRPNLIFVDTQFVDVENNVPGDANATKIIFPDGDVRTVSETVSALQHQYRRLDRTAAASLTAPYDSGANTPSTNNWVAVYAVKTTDDSSKFVLVGTTTYPIASNYATLNSAYGTNGWVYLGMLRNGDSASVSSGWLDFQQSGRQTIFKNTVAATTIHPKTGIRLATVSAATSLAYTYAAGNGVDGFTGQPAIPDNLLFVEYGWSMQSNAISIVQDQAASSYLYIWANATSNGSGRLWLPAETGINLVNDNSNKADIFLMAFIDNVLGVGGNAQF